MLSLTELTRAARVLDARVSGSRVQAIVQPDATSLVLGVYGGRGQGRGRLHLRLVCSPETARVSLLSASPPAPPRPPAFAQLLRARLGGARIGGCRIVGGDRQLGLGLETRDGSGELLLSILGRRSNLVLLDAEGRILAALRPLADTRPELARGEPWRGPESPPPSPGADRFAAVPDAGLLEAIEEHYAGTESRDASRRLRGRLEQALRRQARTLDRKLEKLARELAEAEAATRCERDGQLLKSVLASVRRGDSRALARDFETGEEVEIALDPARSPAENLEALFRRYRKALRTLTKGGAQQEAVRADREVLSGLEAALTELAPQDAEGLAALAARPEVARLLERHAPAERPAPRARPSAATGPGRLAPRRYRSESGLEIWVGRSDEGNDRLSTRLAHGNDLFFHLDGAPGSHVVLRTEGRRDPPSEAVLDACELAVHFSKARNATRADVHVVPIKNVRKPKGAKPGLVTVHGGKTVHLRRVPARLQRLLDSRIDP